MYFAFDKAHTNNLEIYTTQQNKCEYLKCLLLFIFLTDWEIPSLSEVDIILILFFAMWRTISSVTDSGYMHGRLQYLPRNLLFVRVMT